MGKKDSKRKEINGCGMTLRLIQEGAPPTERVSSAEDVFEYMQFLKKEDRENFYCLHLNAANGILGQEHISKGSLTDAIIHPREVFKAAIINNSAGLILVHNHPSGRCSPSRQDIKTTKKLIDAGALLGIDVLDHVIIGSDNYYSLMEKKDTVFHRSGMTIEEKKNKYRIKKEPRY